MKTRTLTRKTLIREYDFNKVKAQALGGLLFDGMALYDRADFTPIDQATLEKLKIADILKGKHHTPLLETKWNSTVPALLLWDLKDYLYDERYRHWQVSIDEDGFICVQARKNTPKSRIGWGVFEKDLTSRI